VYLVDSEQDEDYQRSMFAHATKKAPKASAQKMRTSKPSKFSEETDRKDPKAA
jgi:hypothetical protein